jgi:hypothetical protein
MQFGWIEINYLAYQRCKIAALRGLWHDGKDLSGIPHETFIELSETLEPGNSLLA